MKFIVLVFLGSTLFLRSSLSLANEPAKAFIEVECEFFVDRAYKKDFSMKGYLRLNSQVVTGNTYLTLEPPSSVNIPITARVLLNRFNSSDYFPMTLHPRGNTAEPLSHTRLDGKEEASVVHREGELSYELTCKMI